MIFLRYIWSWFFVGPGPCPGPKARASFWNGPSGPGQLGGPLDWPGPDIVKYKTQLMNHFAWTIVNLEKIRILKTILHVTFCVYRRLSKLFLQSGGCWISLLSWGSLLDISVGPGPGQPKSPIDALVLAQVKVPTNCHGYMKMDLSEGPTNCLGSRPIDRSNELAQDRVRRSNWLHIFCSFDTWGPETVQISKKLARTRANQKVQQQTGRARARSSRFGLKK